MNNKSLKFDLFSYLKEKQNLINKYLKLIFDSYDQNRKLIMAIKHSILGKGKRLRPILSIASAQASKKEFLCALPCCCAIEMIHTYSLIHDDLPSMDDDDLRRGVLTCHKKFDEATAILAGDALLTHAFNILANPEPIFNEYPDSKTRIKLIEIISHAAGIQGMIEGQILDINSSLKTNQDKNQLTKAHNLKTGKIIKASVHAGALSVGSDPDDIEKLIVFGTKIGLAFQVADDILNVEGDPLIMGKSKGSDALNNKRTFPLVIGLEQSKKYAKQLVQDSLDVISSFDENADPLRAIANYIINRDN